MKQENEVIKKKVEDERYEALHQIEDWLEMPIFFLGFIWLILLIVELIWKLNPTLEAAGIIIWIIFFFDFALRFFLAPKKIPYLKGNWLTAISLIVPALRIFRVVRFFQLFRAARAVRGLRLLKVFGSLNRSMRSLRSTMQRRGFIYILIFTIVVIFVGAAGMYAFENNNPAAKGFDNYGDAVWWTAMIMTTLGSEAWPATLEGRILGFVISLYAFAIFGYVTAVLATYFIGRDSQTPETNVSDIKAIEELKNEIQLLREEIRKVN